jgi:hypothetical protein
LAELVSDGSRRRRRGTGQFERAEQAFRRDLTLAKAQHSPDLSALADLYYNQGGLEHARGRHADRPAGGECQSPGQQGAVTPPYALDVAYVGGDAPDYAAWLQSLSTWLTELLRVANPNWGRLCLNVPLDRDLGGWEPVSADAIQGRRAKVDGVHPHRLRHDTARRLVEAVDLPTVAAWLGHERLDTVRVYTQPDEEALERAASALERS